MRYAESEECNWKLCIPFGEHLSTLVLVVRCWFFSLGTKYNLQHFVFRCLQDHEENNMHSFLCVSLRTVVESMFTMTSFMLDFYTPCVDIFLISHLTHPPTRRMRVEETIESLLLLSTETLHLTRSVPPAPIWIYSIQHWKCFYFYPLFLGTERVGVGDSYPVQVFDTAERRASSTAQCKFALYQLI
jgi:hypothetical protein